MTDRELLEKTLEKVSSLEKQQREDHAILKSLEQSGKITSKDIKEVKELLKNINAYPNIIYDA